MGEAIDFARELEQRLKLGMTFIDSNLETLDFRAAARKGGVDRFDAAFVLSVMHHIHDRRGVFERLYDAVEDVIFYEDHEFWNELETDDGTPLELKGDGYRFGWNEDMTWQRRMGSLDKYETRVIMRTARRGATSSCCLTGSPRSSFSASPRSAGPCSRCASACPIRPAAERGRPAAALEPPPRAGAAHTFARQQDEP